MCESIVKTIQDQSREATVRAAWRQWTSLTSGPLPASEPHAWSIIDPEALILVSLAFQEEERRLGDLLPGWAEIASSLVSVQRLRSLASAFPSSTRERMGDWARYAVEAGDRRWHKLARPRSEEEPTPRRKPLGPLELFEGPTLMLRLRAGFGVGTKSDALTFLLGLQGAAAAIRPIAAATGYTGRSVRTACEDMALAGFVEEIRGHPSLFQADPDAWASLLQIYRPGGGGPEAEPTMPPWRFWAPVFAFLTHVHEWAKITLRKDASPYLAATTARDLYDDHVEALQRARVEMPSPERVAAAKGEEFLASFARTIETTATWVEEVL